MVTCQENKNAILIALLPFWSPLTPPLGLACLKSYMHLNGYEITTVDANTASELWEIHGTYLKTLQEYIPPEKLGNFYMVGYDVFMNHLMAHINYTDENKYLELVQLLVEKNFYTTITAEEGQELVAVVAQFYSKLEHYLLDLFQRIRPQIFGVSVYNSTLATSLFACKLIKEHYPDVLTVMGGGIFADQLSIGSPTLQLFMEKTPYIDKIIAGEGELLFLKLLRGELPEGQRVYTLKDIENQTVDLSTADIPDFSDFDVSLYPLLASYASRSCPFQCSFCSETVQWGKYRKKSVGQVVDEMSKLQKKYGGQLFLFGDSLINPVVSELAGEFIERGLTIYWDAYLRADEPVCDQERTSMWRKGGFYRARLGIESGSQKILDSMNKKTSVDQIKAALRSLAQAGIKTTTYWVLGHPGETEEDFQATLDLVEEMHESIYEVDWHPFFYYPSGQVNSEKWATENGLRLLYPEDTTDMLITPTWELNALPTREETYERVQRFAEHCKRLSIPNPYSLKDIYEADQRWKKLQKNAVPPLADLYNSKEKVGHDSEVNLLMPEKLASEDGDFNF